MALHQKLRWALPLLALALIVGVVGSPAEAASGDATPSQPFDEPRAIVIDPGTGRLFLSGDDAVAVYNAEGSLLTTIGPVPGAWGMDATQGAIWVNQSTAGRITKIDPISLSIVHTYDVGTGLDDDLTVIGDTAWFGRAYPDRGVGRFDLETSELTGMATRVNSAATGRMGTSTTDLLVYERGVSNGAMYRQSTSPPYDNLASGQAGAYLGDVTVSGDGARAWSAAWTPNYFQEYDTATFANTGTRYRTTGGKDDIVWSPAHGGLLVGAADDAVFTYAPGIPAPISRIEVPDQSSVDDLAVSPDGATAYLLVSDHHPAQDPLRLVDLRPSADGASPSTVVAGVPTTIEVTGRSLGGTTSVTVGGIEVETLAVDPDRVTFELPATLATGSQPVVLRGRTGDAATSIDVEPTTGASLAGTVRIGEAIGSGVDVTLSGGDLSSPTTQTTDGAGSFSFAGVGYGADYVLTVHDPADAAPDQVITNIGLLPNETVTVDVDLSRPSGQGADLARTRLGSPLVRDLIVHPASGKVVIATGDEVDIVDPDGRLVARIRDLFGARSLSLDGDDLYVGLASLGTITRIHLPTASVTGSWSAGGLIEGSIAHAGGRVWFISTGVYASSRMRSLDPASGSISEPLGSAPENSYLRSVLGAPDEFTVTEYGYRTTRYEVVDGEATAAATMARGVAATPVLPVASTGRLYDAEGRSFHLTDLTSDGVDRPGTGQPAYTEGRGGLVAVGGTVTRHDQPLPTHEFEGTWSGTGLDLAGDRLYTTVADELVVHDLAPHVTATVPARLYPQGTASVVGSGLGEVDEVTIDGTPSPFDAVSATLLDIDLADLDPGIHRLVVTTPWGSTTEVPLTIHPLRAPHPPTDVTATVSDQDVVVTWQAPADDGGREVTAYEVTSQPGGRTCTTGGALSCTVGGLATGTAYTFTVTATSSVGTSDPSAASAPVRTPTVPGPPTAPVVTAGSSRAYLTWSPPADDGGSTPVSWRVCWSTDPAVPAGPGSTCTNTERRSRSYTITDLTPGTSYWTTVAATNIVGTGPATAPSGPTVPFTAADAPRALTATPGRLSAELAWQAPLDDGGAAVHGYRVCASDQEDMSSDATSCTTVEGATSTVVDGLHGGVTHWFTVAAMNAAGPGPVASTSAAVAVATPAPPTDVVAVPGAGSIDLRWTIPHDGGDPITGYEVCTAADPTMVDATCATVPGPDEATIAGLAPGVTRYATVAATNALGTGPASAPTVGATPYTTPSAPTNVVATAGDSVATVRFDQPASTGGSPITGYVIVPHEDGSAVPPQAFDGPATARTVTGLTNGRSYTFTVQAVNAAGPGTPSAPSDAVVPSLPGPSHRPFDDWDGWVAQQRGDFTGDPGTTASRAGDVAALEDGDTSPQDYVDGLIADPWYEPNVAPAARLYWAYFGRIPDHGGLQFWVRRRRTGTTLIRISASFAGSSEFRTTYGSLDHGEFVDLVYRNVLGRDPDPGGRAFWVGRLQRGTSRGQVMINFSESGEYVRQMEGPIGVVLVVEAMLGRAPTAAEVDTWADEPRPDLIAHVLASDEYAARVS